MSTDTYIHPRRSRMRVLAIAAVATLAVFGAACRPFPAGGGGATPPPPSKPLPTVVLVHGAFADASGWDGVIQRLQAKGYPVIAPANPLRSLPGDAAYIRTVLDSIEGPVILVGHSYGGMVMTNAATGAPNVKALVYIAAFAPDVGDSVGSLSAMNPGSGVTEANLIIRPNGLGSADGYIKAEVFRQVFAGDLPKATTAVMQASQRPADLGVLGQPSAEPAWKSIPSWYMVASKDHVIPAATERFMAERAGATTVEVDSSHVAMISHPGETTRLITTAAKAVG